MSTEKDLKSEKAEKAVKEPRMHSPAGRIPRKVVRTYYDPKEDVVRDVVEVPKTVKINQGRDTEHIKLYVHVVCLDEELQAKYRKGPAPAKVEITEVD